MTTGSWCRVSEDGTDSKSVWASTELNGACSVQSRARIKPTPRPIAMKKRVCLCFIEELPLLDIGEKQTPLRTIGRYK